MLNKLNGVSSPVVESRDSFNNEDMSSSAGSRSTTAGVGKPPKWQLKKSPARNREGTSLMFDALAQPVASQTTSSANNSMPVQNGTADSTNAGEVYMVVDDPAYLAGLRLFTNHRPVSTGDDLCQSAEFEGQTNMHALIKTDSDGMHKFEGTDSDFVEDKEAGNTQHSFVTIFSVWNTMMGTSILAMPWTLQQAGFGFGIFLILLVAAIACYTAYLALRTTEDIKTIKGNQESGFMDIADACYFHFGKSGRMFALVFSQISLLGASIVYYVLLTNFLFHTGEYIYQSVTHQVPVTPEIEGNTQNISNILCPRYAKPTNLTSVSDDSIYYKLWIKNRTVPAWLLIIIFPLISVKSPTCLGKFTTLATVSVTYLFILIGIKGYGWGVNMSSPPLIEPVLNFRGYFPALTGTCSLAFYIHNALHTIMRAQRHPQNNVRDASIAFTFTTATYALMGTIFFIVFPVSKMCIEDNYLNNLVTDIPVFIGRLGLLFQMSMVYPMIVYILRAQIMHAVFGSIYPSWYSVLILHLIIVGLGMLFAIVYPSIGTIIRFIGALCGLVYIFTIPTVITLMNKWILGHKRTNTTSSDNETDQDVSLLRDSTEKGSSNQWIDQRTKQMWYLRCALYAVIISLGVANFVAQFVLLAFE